MAEQVDAVVIGAGVVGLAVARALALAGRDVLVLESERSIGSGVSSRNSEVIHAGLYYRPGSLKGRLCVAGNRMLYAYCDERGIGYKRCGKMVVASHVGQVAELERLLNTAQANGMDGLRLLSSREATQLEPALACSAALHSANSGIVDTHALMLSLQGDAENAGATVALASPVVSGKVQDDGILLNAGIDEPFALQARLVVNCAGLHAQRVARHIEGFPAERIPPSFFAKGNYFSISGRAPFTHLIYPIPESAGLGVHLTLDMAGQARFGPDVEWIDRLDYEVDPQRAAVFYEAIRTYWPGLRDGALQPAYSGIRPKIEGPGSSGADFMISGPQQHGVPGMIQLYGIESPGLTASMAIGDMVAAMASDHTR